MIDSAVQKVLADPDLRDRYDQARQRTLDAMPDEAAAGRSYRVILVELNRVMSERFKLIESETPRDYRPHYERISELREQEEALRRELNGGLL